MLHSMVSHRWGNEHLTKFATYLLPCLTVNHISVQFQALYISVWEIKINFSQIRSWTLAIPRRNGASFLFFDNWYVVLWHFFQNPFFGVGLRLNQYKRKIIINNKLLSCWEMQWENARTLIILSSVLFFSLK